MAKSTPTKSVEILLRASVYVPVSAKTLEDALEIGRKLTLRDIADFSGNELIDYNIEVTGLSDPTMYDKINA